MPLRRQWSELSLEKKLSIVVIPLTVTLIGVFVPIFLTKGGNGGTTPPAAAEKRSNLELIDMGSRRRRADAQAEPAPAHRLHRPKLG
jgi:hypothetical protein